MEPASLMKNRAAILLLIALPALLALALAVSFHARNRNNGSMVSSGEKREYLLYVPRRYDRSKPVPLVISMHGAGGWPAQQMNLTGWNRLADAEGFIVVYPWAVGGGPRTWRVKPGPGLTKDVRFIAELIDRIAAEYNIDRDRIYANGLSNGAGMAFVLSCTLSDRIAAIGAVSAAQTLRWSWCTDTRAVPMIAIHGREDRLTPYDGGSSWIGAATFPAVTKWVASWARRNRCAPNAMESAMTGGVTRREYADCANGAGVVLYTVDGAGHVWPGGQEMPEWFVGPHSDSIDATKQIWEFFRAHPLQRARK
jgi:polyhydroxybutyrate depolymerase